jgi:protein phosphatase
VASSIAVDAVVDCLATAAQRADRHDPSVDLHDPSADLIQAVQRANEAILAAAARRPECLGMGTTVAVLTIARDCAWFAHVGDSRIYLQRAGELVRLTRDHSVGQAMADAGLAGDAAKTMAMGGVLTRALGVGVSVDTDVGHVGIADGDRLLLCSDGLTDLVAEESIRGLLGRREPASTSAHRLVEAALDAGGLDNVTALVIDIGDTVPGR